LDSNFYKSKKLKYTFKGYVLLYNIAARVKAARVKAGNVKAARVKGVKGIKGIKAIECQAY
jgi:hypothetical protein